MLYKYEDIFLTSKVDEQELEELENKKYQEALNLGLSGFYLEEYVKAKVYEEIARRNLEADGMQEKMDAYKQRAEEVYEIAKTKTPAGIGTMKIARE